MFCFSIMMSFSSIFIFFFFNDTATTEIYTLSLHDALPICLKGQLGNPDRAGEVIRVQLSSLEVECERLSKEPLVRVRNGDDARSEEHTSELQSLAYLVCRLLLEKKKKKIISQYHMSERSKCTNAL